MTDDLVTWLRAQLDEDERVAQAAQGQLVEAYGSDEVFAHFDRWSPARVLREVAAKRAIVDRLDGLGDPGDALDDGIRHEAETVLRLLASAYADRPGYREEWKT